MSVKDMAPILCEGSAMGNPRLFIEADLAEGALVPGVAGQGHFLGSVMRRASGDPVVLLNGRDGAFAATIAEMKRDAVRFAVGARLSPFSPAPPIRLVLAALKREAMEWSVEKATELGVAEIRPVLTQRAVADRVNLDRLRLIAREAAEQSERLDLPALHEAVPLPRLLEAWDGAPLFAATERAEAPHLSRAATPPPAALLIGPEGGFTRAELDDLARRAFVSRVTLGARILRAETAAVAGLSLLAAAAHPA
jgi:16S rRNA (uracil1498-N3)-methyltransferase